MRILKEHSIAALEAALAKSITELTGEACSVSINELKINEMVNSGTFSVAVYPVTSDQFKGAI